jgi:hypothetical protein
MRLLPGIRRFADASCVEIRRVALGHIAIGDRDLGGNGTIRFQARSARMVNRQSALAAGCAPQC